MQNNTSVIAQQMMSRQVPYGPVGMVSQDMSGNKKGGASATNLTFNPSTGASGVIFSNNNLTATNTRRSSGGTFVAATASRATPSGNSATYVEFVLGSVSNHYLGFALASSWSNGSGNPVGGGGGTNSISLYTTTGQIFLNGTQVSSAGALTYLVGDVIGIVCEQNIVQGVCGFQWYLNGAIIAFWNASSLPTGFAYIPVWSTDTSGASVSISNSIYSPPDTLYTSPTSTSIPLGVFANRVSINASVPAVADGAYDVYTFRSSGVFTATSTGGIRTLVIAGGGGANGSGGGGAGGYLPLSIMATPQTYVVTVGAGGGNSAQGTNSSIAAAIVSVGGGAGTGPNATANGGSGGGASPSFPFSGPYGPSAGGNATTRQGFNGGQSSGTTTSGAGAAGGGGGGSNDAGTSGYTGAPGNGFGGQGGAGVASNITGTSVQRAGGGGGYGDYSGGGGTGGGGTGGTAGAGTAGTVNTGGGGGGSSASGGSGIVILRVRARA